MLEVKKTSTVRNNVTKIWNTFFAPKTLFNDFISLTKTAKSICALLIVTQLIAFFYAKDYSINGYLGFAVALFTIFNLILVDQNKLTNYTWGLPAAAFWLIVAINNKLIGDIASQSFYFVMQFVGMYVWAKNVDKIRKMTKTKAIFVALFTIALYGAVLFTSKSLNGNEVYLDALQLPLGIVGQVLMTYKYKAQWVAWLILDASTIVIWYSRLGAGGAAATSMFVLQILMFVNAIYGAYKWNQAQKENELKGDN